MKTPDEIKMGLRFAETNCLYVECCEDICPYNKNCDVSDPDRMAEMPRIIATDALAYIQQLERERDALLEIVRNEANCQVCKHLKEECDGDCSFCEIEEPCACKGCTTKDIHWEYAGIKEVAP